MKKINFKILAVLVITLAYQVPGTFSFAQAPQKMSYQAIIRDANSKLVTSHTIGMKISILNTSISGTDVYVETQTATTNANGLVTIEIGGGTVVSGIFASIDWANGPYFIKTETDPTGSTNYTISGTSQLLSVPYALHAKTAENSFSGNYNDLTNIPIIPTSISKFTNDAGYLQSEVDGSVTNELQTLTISNDTIFLSNGGFVKLPAASSIALIPPTAIVQAATNVQSNTATLNGTVNGNGLSTTVFFEWGLNTTYGVTASTSQSPISGNSNVAVSADVTFQYATTYHYRIKATNAVNVSYSSDMTFTTLPLPLATLTTTAATTITSTTAISGGNISSDGGTTVTARGVCWSKFPNPTISDNITLDGIGTGLFTSLITGLTPGTLCFVRAYCTNNIGTAYGNELNFIIPMLAIGDSYQGGKIAYILQPGDPGYNDSETHGLIAAPSNQSNSAWGCWLTAISGADDTAVGTGNQNTIDIIAGCSTAGIAAIICGDLVLGGYSDWYLPSKDELYKLYLNQAAIGGFVSENYWSSSEVDSMNAWKLNFGNGNASSNSDKSNVRYVRAVRTF